MRLHSPATRMSLLVLALLASLLVTAAQGEVSAQLADQGARTWSLRPRPLVETKFYLVTEAGLLLSGEAMKIADRAWGPDLALIWDVGAMRNISPRIAVGGTLGFTQGNDRNEFSLALKPRVRYWSRPITVDVSPGIILAHNSFEDGPRPRFFIEATTMYRDLAGISARVLSTYIEYPVNQPSEPFRLAAFNKTDFYLGLRLGSYPGTVAGVLTAAGAVVITNLFWDD